MTADAASFPCSVLAGGVAFAVLASAGSSRSAVRGVHGDALKVAVRAAPERGKANAEVAEVLAEFLGVPPRQVRIVAGLTARQKRVEVAGLGVPEFRARLAAALARAKE